MFLHISCKKATYLISKKEQHQIGFYENIVLQLHLGICSVCKRFKEQTTFIIKHSHHHSADHTLSKETKERIINEIEKIAENDE